MIRMSLARFQSVLLRLPLILWVHAFGCSSHGGVPASPTDLAGVPASDMAHGGTASDLRQEKAFLWLKQVPASTNVDMVRQIAVDKASNVFVACQFSAATDFGDGPRTGRGNHDVALVKYTAAGDLVWVRQFGGPDEDWALRLVIDPSGNVIIAGSFNGTVDFGAGPVTSHGRDDYYLAKYSGDGGLVWAKAIGSDGIERDNAGLAVDDGGNLYFAGYFGFGGMSGSIDLGGGLLTSAGYSDGFVAKFDPSGTHVFSRRLGGPSIDYVMSVALDKNGDILIGGQLSGAVDLGGGTMDPGAPGAPWAFVERLDKNGLYKSAVSYYSNGSRVNDLVIDESGAITVAGAYVGSFQTKTASLSGTGSQYHGFLLQLDATGTEKWARGIVSGSAEDYPWTVLIDGSRILVGGMFDGSGNFGLGPRTALGSSDGYLAAYSLTGAPQWVLQVGGTETEWIGAIARSTDALYTGGVFSGTVDFGGVVLTVKGGLDGFLMKLPPTPPVTP